MSSMKGFFLLAIFLATTSGLASGEPFALMTCRETWPTKASPLRVRVSSAHLTLQMNGNTYAIALARCRFSTSQIGQFNCQANEAGDRVLALSNRFFKGSLNTVQFSATLNNGSTTKSEFFTVQRTNIDGFGHPSECLVDNEYVYVRK